jgi:coenzyme Q-binding protein COQ10
MPSITQSRTLPHKASHLYDLVMDIEKYPEFLPWCRQAKIVKKISDENLQADLLINFKNFFEKYRSDVKHGESSVGAYFVDVVAIEGPFKKLVNKWEIREVGNDKCEVKFFIEFEFNSIFLTKMIGGIFERATEKMMMAFEERAKALSG